MSGSAHLSNYKFALRERFIVKKPVLSYWDTLWVCGTAAAVAENNFQKDLAAV